MLRRSVLTRLAVLLGAALLAAACGDDDVSSGNSDREERAESQISDQLADRLGEECGFLAQFVGAGLGDAFDPSALLAGGSFDLGEAFGPVAEEFQEVADAAPDEIRDAFRTLADGFGDLVEQFGAIEIDFSDPQDIDPEALQIFESIDAAFDGDEFDDATEKIEQWIGDNCEDAEGLFGEGGPFAN